MCGIGGILDLSARPVPDLRRSLNAMNALQAHRGPDGEAVWAHHRGHLGLAHRRLRIIDLETGDQPMQDGRGNWITYNGEIYNYLELRDELGRSSFRTKSDTEVILEAYGRWGEDCVTHLRGMFAFALWDERRQVLFCARDRFGIKPFYYTIANGTFYFASEVKALLPFLDAIQTDQEGLKDYLAFQFCLDGKTLFRGVRELRPAHALTVSGTQVAPRQYWDVHYRLDFQHDSRYFEERIRESLSESVEMHLRSDVPVGSYVSGGLDSAIVAAIAASRRPNGFRGFTGRFVEGEAYDESRYARLLANAGQFPLQEAEIRQDDFVRDIEAVIYHLDFPTAGPGSFPQYVVSRLAGSQVKVVLGGQGGDEIFGGYTRYLIAYFEQCIKAAIDGTSHTGNFIVTYESIIPNLVALRNYKPMLQEFWREGLFEDLDRRYFRLINRASELDDEIHWDALGSYSPYDTFHAIFRGGNVGKESYFDSMTHFDFKTLLPALLHVEDRVSMAHGLESRVPMLDHPLVELAATIPSDIKFKDGSMKHLLRAATRSIIPSAISDRQDKMGFPVPLQEWMRERGPVRDLITDVLSSSRALQRDFVDNRVVLSKLDREPQFGRKLWGLLSLELWQRAFHDRAHEYRRSVEAELVP